MLKKQFRLKKNKDFRVVYKKGKAFFSPSIVMYALRNASPEKRIGITVSKKVGNAVVRNKIKRRLREICRINLHNLKDGYDIIFVARATSKTKMYRDLEKEALRMFKISKVNKVE